MLMRFRRSLDFTSGAVRRGLPVADPARPCLGSLGISRLLPPSSVIFISLALLLWAPLPAGAQSNCELIQERIQSLTREIKKDVADYEKLMIGIDQMKQRPLGGRQIETLERDKQVALYIRKNVPANVSQLTPTIRRARAARCLPSADLDAIQEEADQMARQISGDARPI